MAQVREWKLCMPDFSTALMASYYKHTGDRILEKKWKEAEASVLYNP